MIVSNKIKTEETGIDISDLICPRCGGQYLHHTGATFYERGEDQKQEVVIEVIGPKVSTSVQDAATSSNPSRRRHGMLIHFECEGCIGDIDLALAQHKGSTEITWIYEPTKDQDPLDI